MLRDVGLDGEPHVGLKVGGADDAPRQWLQQVRLLADLRANSGGGCDGDGKYR
jgi:hypothetical protein